MSLDSGDKSFSKNDEFPMHFIPFPVLSPYARMPTPTPPREGQDDLVVSVTPRFILQTQYRKSKKKNPVTAYVDNNCTVVYLHLAETDCRCVDH